MVQLWVHIAKHSTYLFGLLPIKKLFAVVSFHFCISLSLVSSNFWVLCWVSSSDVEFSIISFFLTVEFSSSMTISHNFPSYYVFDTDNTDGLVSLYLCDFDTSTSLLVGCEMWRDHPLIQTCLLARVMHHHWHRFLPWFPFLDIKWPHLLLGF